MDPLETQDPYAGDALDQFLNSPVEPVAPPPTASRSPTAQGGGQAPVLDDDGSFAAGSRGFADTFTFGFLDELGGVADTLVPGGTRENVFTSDRGFSAILASNIAQNRALLKADTERHYGAQIGGQIAGGLIMPFGAGAKGALQVAKVGAVQGAAYGVGSGEGLGDRVEKGAVGLGVGFAAGAVLGKAVEAGGRLVGKLRGKTAPAGAENALDTAPLVADEVAPVVQGPDGTPYATRLEDGSELVGFGRNEDGTSFPQYGTPKVDPAAPVPEEMVPLEAPPLTPDAPPTPVGSIGRAELTALQDDVAKFRANPGRANDITASQTPEEAARVGEFRLGNLGEGPDTQALLRSLAAQLPSSVRKTDQELATTASEIAGSVGEDPEAMLAWAKAAAGTLGDVDNTMMALRSVWSQASKQVNEIHLAGVNWAEADDALVLQAGQAIRNLSELSHQVQIAKVGLGRGLRVNALPDAETYLKTLAGKADEAGAKATPEATGPQPVPPREAPPLPRNRQEIQDWLDLWGMQAGNPKGQSDFLAGLLTVPKPGKYLRTSVANLFTASILSAPKTIAMNIVGPTLLSLVRNGERMGGAAAMVLNPLASPAERAAARAVARETPIAYMRTLGDIQEAFRFGLQAAERNQSVLGGGSSTTDALASYGPLTNNLLGAAGADPNWMYSLGNMLNVFPKAFARLNNGLDETAKRLSYMGEVRVRAQVEAAQRGLSGDDAANFVREKLKGSFDEVGHASDQELLRAAERTTLTSQVGEEGGWVRRFGNGVQGLRRDIPEVRFIVPVFNVPANALGETLRRVPIANRMFKAHAADLAGDNGVVAQAEAHGRSMLGAGFLMAGIMLNRQGLVTGAGPQEPTDRKVWLQTHQPYSIRVGDQWVRYDKFDILGGLMSIPASISDASTYRPADEGIGDMIAAGTGALATWFKDRAALRTAADLLNLGSNPIQDSGAFAERFAGSVAAGLIPGSGAIRTLGVDTTDPYNRMKTEWTDYLKAAIPGLSQTLEPVRNVLGEPIQRSADTFAESIFPVTMQSAVTYADDPVMDELARVYEVTGYGAGADPKSLGYGHFNPKEVKLEDGRSLYDRAMQKRMTLEIDGLTLRQTLKDLFDSQDYNDAVDADSSQRVTSLGDPSRGYMVRQVFDRFNKAAKAEVANESPTADRYLTAAAAKERDDAYLRDVSVEQLVTTPRLYQDRGIDPEAYSEKVRGGVGADPLAAALGL